MQFIYRRTEILPALRAEQRKAFYRIAQSDRAVELMFYQPALILQSRNSVIMRVYLCFTLWDNHIFYLGDLLFVTLDKSLCKRVILGEGFQRFVQIFELLGFCGQLVNLRFISRYLILPPRYLLINCVYPALMKLRFRFENRQELPRLLKARGLLFVEVKGLFFFLLFRLLFLYGHGHLSFVFFV